MNMWKTIPKKMKFEYSWTENQKQKIEKSPWKVMKDHISAT